MNNIMQLDMKLLLENSTIDKDNETLMVNKNGLKLASAGFKNGKKLGTVDYNCHLFDQTQKALYKIGDYETTLDKIFFILNFEKCGDKHYNYLRNAKNGIVLDIDDKPITIVDYYKSSSMSRESKIYYINKEYYDLVDERISFGINKPTEAIDLSKWYAYTGLTITDCHLINDIKFNKDEVVIVPDKEKILLTSCLTAVSIPSLFDDINSLINLLKNKEKVNIKENFNINYLYSKFNCYKNSKDYNNLTIEVKDIVDTVLSYDKPIEEYVDSLKNIKIKYESFNDNNLEVNWEKINLEDYPVKINYYDGEGLISMSLDKKINESLMGIKFKTDNESDDNNDDYKYTGEVNFVNHSFQIRLPFVKGVVHSCDLQKFFKEHNVTTIKGKTYNGDELREYDVKNIKMILTESQFKMSKFINSLDLEEGETPIDAYFRLLNKYNYSFGISNVESYSKVDYVKLCYQFFSTMPLTKYESRDLFMANQEYLNLISNNEEIINGIRDVNNKYTALLDVYELNKDFAFNTSLFKNIKNNAIKLEKENTVVSKMNVKGTRKFLSADLLGLLYYIIDKDYDCKLATNEFYMPNTNIPSNKYPMALLRNPHYSRNEIKMLWPSTIYTERDEYFGHLTGVCMVNPLSLTAERLGGADYDGDSIIVTWQPMLVNTLYRNLYFNDNELYPVVIIPSISSNKNLNNYDNRLVCIKNTFKSFVGKISDQCFVESLDAYNEGRNDDVAFYTILNGLEIDSAKNGRKPKIPDSKLSGANKNSVFIDLKNAIKQEKKINDFLEKIKSFDGVLFDNINTLNSYYKVKEKLKLPNLPINSNISTNKAIELASIINAYEAFRRATRRFNDINIKYSSKNIESLFKQLNTILENNNYKLDLDELISNFNSDNPYDCLSDYLNKKFYYSKDDDQKNDLLFDLGFYKIDEEYKEPVLNFDNEGFKVLYLILYYLKDNGAKLFFDKEYFCKNLYKNNLKKCDSNYQKLILKRSHEIIEDINSIVDKETEGKSLSKDKLDICKDLVLKYLDNLTKSFTIADLNYVCNIYNTNIIFDIFNKRLKDELAIIGKGGK